MKRTLCAVGLATLSLICAAPGAPQVAPPSDHLKCYKVKDSRAKASYTADLQGLAVEPGCIIKVPGKLLCVETNKTNIHPTPPGGVSFTPAGRFVCYSVKCPKAKLPAVAWLDQFGPGTLIPSTANLLCAPALPTTFPTCPVRGNSCGHCGSGICSSDVDGRPVCCASIFGPHLCTSDDSCGSGEACVVVVLPQGVTTSCCSACN